MINLTTLFYVRRSSYARLLTSKVCKLGIAIELFQVRTGYPVNRPSLRGPVPVDTEAARKDEMMEVWQRIRGREGDEMREKVKVVRAQMMESWSGGSFKREMRNLARWGC